MDVEFIVEYVEGIIIIIGCLLGEVQICLWFGQDWEVFEVVVKWWEIVGLDNYFFELMDYGLIIECWVCDGLFEIGCVFNILFFVINDCYYVICDVVYNYEVLLCVQIGKIFLDLNCFKFDGDGYYLKLVVEMCQIWDDEVLGVCDFILLIVEWVQFYVDVWILCDWMFVFLVFDGYDQVFWLCYEVDVGFCW